MKIFNKSLIFFVFVISLSLFVVSNLAFADLSGDIVKKINPGYIAPQDVYINTDPQAADLFLNGVYVGSSNTQLKLEVKRYNLTIIKPGYRTKTQKKNIQ